MELETYALKVEKPMDDALNKIKEFQHQFYEKQHSNWTKNQKSEATCTDKPLLYKFLYLFFQNIPEGNDHEQQGKDQQETRRPARP